MKGYWFALKSHVYVDFKRKGILLYDTKQGHCIETSSPEAIELIAQIYEPENLGVIPVKDEWYTNQYLWGFIQDILENGMGDLLEMNAYSRKPVRLVPILNLQKDIDKFTENEYKETFIGKEISKYLLEVNIYLNNSCEQTCGHCSGYFKQVHCCMSEGDCNELSVGNLRKVFEQLRYSSVSTVNLLGGNLLKYSHIPQLQELSLYFPQRIHCYVHYENYQKHELFDSLKLELIVTFPMDVECFQEAWKLIDVENTKVHFIIENESQYESAEYLINTYSIKQYQIHPYYTGKNLSFFEENIYVDKEDIFYKTFQMREVFKNQKLNSNFFGTLYVLSDGIIKANMNTPILGNIATDDLLNVVCKELIGNTAWRTVRDSEPCSECAYQYFCPAPSEYERVIGKNNLCHIKTP